MSVVYANPPLVEALCQFQFEPSKPWDFTVPGLLYARVGDEFPDTQDQPSLQFDLQFDQPAIPQVSANTGAMQFFRRDRTALLQLRPDVLIINQLPKYPRWEMFRDLILRSLDHYQMVAKPVAILQMQMRYINRLDIPASHDLNELTRYCTAIPGVPASLTQGVASRFSQRVEIIMPEAYGVLVLQSGVVPSETSGKFGLLLDLEFASAFAKPVALDTAAEWIGRAHDDVKRAFQACYTSSTIESFGEVQCE